MKKGEKIFTRSLIIECFEQDNHQLLVQGTLTDERFFPYLVYATQEIEEPGIIHGMEISLLIDISSLTIREVTTKTPVIPMAGCEETKLSLQKLINLQIKPGLTGEIRRIIGKSRGCLHLNNLLLAMLAAAMQGLWAYHSRKRESGFVATPDVDLSLMIDSCWMWRKGGPLAEKITTMLRELHKEIS